MNWTTHEPKFDGDAPDGVTLDTHEVDRQYVVGQGWARMDNPFWFCGEQYRYRQKESQE